MSLDDARWRSAGIGSQAQKTFEEWKIGLDDAIRWHQAGVTDGLSATRWQIARIAPVAVGDWRAAGIESVEALQWCQLGYDLESAKKDKAQGIAPGSLNSPKTSQPPGRTMRVSTQRLTRLPSGVEPDPGFRAWADEHGGRCAYLYMMAGWVTDEALPWAQADVPPDSARVWLALGVRPAEAARSEKAGVHVSDVVREWWSVGIALDQVAAWLGAGLTPAEAAEQIAAGVTPDQAAVLRALLDEEGDD